MPYTIILTDVPNTEIKDICKFHRPCDDVCINREDGGFDCSCSVGHFLVLDKDGRTCTR